MKSKLGTSAVCNFWLSLRDLFSKNEVRSRFSELSFFQGSKAWLVVSLSYKRKKAELMLGFSVLTNLITQQQLLQQQGDLQAQCKPLELYRQHGSQLLGYECNRPDEQQNVDLVR